MMVRIWNQLLCVVSVTASEWNVVNDMLDNLEKTCCMRLVSAFNTRWVE